ncbi:unnamed protein product [Prorocentrum cordatum]|uniref:Uncharacterized protein n=1 Tax=Prorocentrum cordatum TaxID=2364126 RepID=A0ABN9SVU8_9DINO|nr:unnamed protein product [Polarella glacialis]
MGAAGCKCDESIVSHVVEHATSHKEVAATAAAPAEEAETPKPDQFAGIWLTGKGNSHLIGLDAIQWSDGVVTNVLKKKVKGVMTLVTRREQTTYYAGLTPDGKLQWSDGDLWVRSQDTPMTGSYRGAGHAYEYLESAIQGVPGVSLIPGLIDQDSACAERSRVPLKNSPFYADADRRRSERAAPVRGAESNSTSESSPPWRRAQSAPAATEASPSGSEVRSSDGRSIAPRPKRKAEPRGH